MILALRGEGKKIRSSRSSLATQRKKGGREGKREGKRKEEKRKLWVLEQSLNFDLIPACSALAWPLGGTVSFV